MSAQTRNYISRVALLLGIVIGVLTLLYAGYQAAVYYQRQSSIQKDNEEKAKERLALKTAQLRLLFDGIEKDAAAAASTEATSILLTPERNYDDKQHSLAIASVALRNAFSYLAINKNGTYGKMALLSTNGTELATAVFIGEYSEAKVEKDKLALIAKNGSTFTSLADNRFVIVQPCLLNATHSGYIVFWLHVDAPLALLMRGETPAEGSTFALVSDKGHLLYRAKDSKIFATSTLTGLLGRQFIKTTGNTPKEGEPNPTKAVCVAIERTPFSAVYVAPYKGFAQLLSLTSILAWGGILAVGIIFCGIHIFALHSRYSALKSTCSRLEAEKQFLQSALDEKNAVLAAIVGELRASLTSLIIVADGTRKKMADIVLPQIGEGAAVIRQAGERILENIEAMFTSSRKVSSFLGALASYIDGGESAWEDEVETVDVVEITQIARDNIVAVLNNDVSISVSGAPLLLQVKRRLLSLALENFLITAAIMKKKGNINISVAADEGNAVLEATFVLDQNGWKSISYSEYAGIKSEGGAFVAFAAASKMFSLFGGSLNMSEERGFSLLTARLPLTNTE